MSAETLTPLSPGDRKLVAQLTQRVLKSLSQDGKRVVLTAAKQAELASFLASFTASKPRTIAIGALVKFAHVLDTKVDSTDASKRLLDIASAMIPKQ
jgi:hypothetical protein